LDWGKWLYSGQVLELLGFKFQIISFTGNDCLHTVVSQAAFSKAKQISNPLATGAVLCGQRQMTEVCY